MRRNYRLSKLTESLFVLNPAQGNANELAAASAGNGSVCVLWHSKCSYDILIKVFESLQYALRMCIAKILNLSSGL